MNIKEVEYWESEDDDGGGAKGISAVASVNTWSSDSPEDILAELKLWVRQQLGEQPMGVEQITELRREYDFWFHHLNDLKNRYNAARDVCMNHGIALDAWPHYQVSSGDELAQSRSEPF